jgi:hypothetical protein
MSLRDESQGGETVAVYRQNQPTGRRMHTLKRRWMLWKNVFSAPLLISQQNSLPQFLTVTISIYIRIPNYGCKVCIPLPEPCPFLYVTTISPPA